MKKIILTFLCITLTLTGCTLKTNKNTETIVPTDEIIESTSDSIQLVNEDTIHFDSLDDQKLLEYLQDSLYAGLECEFASDDYIIENINAIYFPKEYLEEVVYNTKSNIWFGYTIDELKEQFEDTPYIFTLASDGSTEVVPIVNNDDIYEKVIKNVAIGTGVILICVTVSIVSAGVGSTKVNTIFAASAKEATKMALSEGVICAAIAASIIGVQTKDFDQTKKEALLQASEGFKWGAIVGAIKGGVKATIGLNNSTTFDNKILSPTEKGQQSEQRAFEKYGGEKQVSYLAGEKVSSKTPGATRPDLTRMVNGKIEAIEVKNYDLSNSNNVRSLCNELYRQISERIANLPKGSAQRVVLDVTNRGFSKEVIENAIEEITEALIDIYPNIPIDVIGG